MRIFATSDLHVDYELNAQWVENLSRVDFTSDMLLVAGDVSDSIRKLEWCLMELVRRFDKVLFVPGNHDLWVFRESEQIHSLEKFDRISRVVRQCGASMEVFQRGGVSVVPLFGWYDDSFGVPDERLKGLWMDYRACRWPPQMTADDVSAYFHGMNRYVRTSDSETIISFSHFLPRLDLMPPFIPVSMRYLYPVLGSATLGEHVGRLKSAVHVYGHSHVNRCMRIEGTLYINNAFAYPHETRIAAKGLQCVYEIT